MRKYLIIIIILNQILIASILYSRSFAHPESYLIDDFPLHRQPDGITCGPTSAAMVLQFYGKNVSIDEAKTAGKTQWFTWKDRAVGMTAPDYIPVILKEYGVSAKLRYGRLGKVKHYVSQDRPVIVLLRSGYQTWHYVVVIGYDAEKIIVADPGYGQIEEMPNDHFFMAWDFSGDMDGEKIDCDPDWYGILVRLAEVRGNLMIISG